MKCVSIDLDGTLLNAQHEVSNENLEALKKAQKKGIQVIVNTGRALADVLNVKGINDLNCPIFCINGATLYSETRELMYEATLSFDVYKKMVSLLQPLGVQLLVYTNEGGFPVRLPELLTKTKEEQEYMFKHTDYNALATKKGIKIYKVIAYAGRGNVEKIKQAKALIANETGIAYSSSFPDNVEITSDQAEKGKAIRYFEKMRGVTFEKVYAFGDGGNDVSQFREADVAIAMENAPDSVKQHADMITKTNIEHGVAYALKELLHLI